MFRSLWFDFRTTIRHDPAVPDFRYAQFCPMARATEILGERWTMLVVRELLLGPQRFSDLRRRLPGLSSSVLTARLRQLEERGLLSRRELPPPAAANVFELTELGQALRPVMLELTRWGIRLMRPPEPGDHFEPSWLRLGLHAFASPSPTPARRYALRIPDGRHEVAIRVEGGPGGTSVADDGPQLTEDWEILLRGDAMQFFALMSGAVDPVEAAGRGDIVVEGDLAALADFPALFDLRAMAADEPHANNPSDDATKDETHDIPTS